MEFQLSYFKSDDAVKQSAFKVESERRWKSLSHVRLFATLWNSPGQNTGVGSLSLLQQIFLTQESNHGLLHCRQLSGKPNKPAICSPICCIQYASKIWKTKQCPRDWNRSVFTPIPKKGNAKECSKVHTIVLISHTSKVMLKILQARLQQHMNVNFQMFKLDLETAEEPEIKLSTFTRSSNKQEFQ